jgi:hypothetical protein
MSSVPAISGVAVSDELRLAVVEIEVAREDGLAVLHDIDIGFAMLARGEHFELNAVASFEDGAIGVEQNLVFAERVSRRNVLEARLPRWSSASMRSESMPLAALAEGLMRKTATPEESVDSFCARSGASPK